MDPDTLKNVGGLLLWGVAFFVLMRFSRGALVTGGQGCHGRQQGARPGLWHDGMKGWSWGMGWMGSLLDGVQRQGAPVAMPTKGGNPAGTEEDMKAVLTYICQEFDSQRRKRTGER